MDVPRASAARKKRIRRILIGAVIVIAAVAVTIGLGRLKPAAPTVELATLWPDTVKRGPMLRQVRGLGTLVPESIVWIPATTDGRVERRVVLPGTSVKPDTVIVILSNPELQQELVDAEYKVKGAEAELKNLKVKLQSERLSQEAGAATVESEYKTAKLEANRDLQLKKLGLTADIIAEKSQAKADELANKHLIERKRLDIGTEAIQAQLVVQEATVSQLRAMYELKKSQVSALQVRAGVSGMLQQVPVEEGQRVAVGTNLARVAEPNKLKAELKIQETQAKDIMIGQVASIDTRNGIIPGRVMRIDPAVIQGTVTVDVKLDGELPPGARPDLSVDGTVEIERLADVLSVGRPTYGQPNSQIGLFRIDPDAKGATRVQVKLGRSSVSSIEILEGLKAGDRVILSDMSAMDNYDRIRLN